MESKGLEEKFLVATKAIIKQGMLPFPLNETTISIVKNIVGENEKELDLICAFKKKSSQTMDELKQSSGFDEDTIRNLTDSLAKKGLIFNQPNSQGVMVYRLLPFMSVGVMEYRFMKPLTYSQEEKELARLFSKLVDEIKENLKSNYENLKQLLPQLPPTDRTVVHKEREDGKKIRVVKVDRSVGDYEEVILPSQSVEEIIMKFDDIAVGHCFCRQKKMALGGSCEFHAPLENCFTFGKSARHTIQQGFARRVSKEEALEILRRAGEAGLIHKAYHPNSLVDKPETSICNCCKDCCDTFRLWREGAFPLINVTHHLSMVEEERCTGCGICVERCPTGSIGIGEKGRAERKEEMCIGCGVCARFCPEDAIHMEVRERRVQLLPPLA